MPAPVKPKALKPKASGGEDDTASAGAKPASGGGGGGGGGFNLPFIILLLATMLFSVVGSAVTLYFLGPMVLVPAITAQLPKAGEGGEGEHGEAGAHGEGEHGDGAHPKVEALGINLALSEFTVNLKRLPDTKGSQFLRTKLSLNVSVPEAENCMMHSDEHAPAEGGGGGGHGGGAPAAPEDPVKACEEGFSKKMAPYVPTVRDIINSALMSRTANEIASLEGQEALKDHIVRETNLVLGNTPYQVKRVNLEDFIIQR